jgi:hypothetical protein
MILIPPGTFDNCTYTSASGAKVTTLKCIPVLFGNLIYWLLVFAGIAALIFVIFGGIKFITSGGDPKQTEGARKTLTWAVIGLILILSSFLILRFIGDITGVTCIKSGFGFDNCKNTTIPNIHGG